ncbi:hypothetical protein BH18THE2_BH18THE2_22900 [soil metagenome]
MCLSAYVILGQTDGLIFQPKKCESVFFKHNLIHDFRFLPIMNRLDNIFSNVLDNVQFLSAFLMIVMSAHMTMTNYHIIVFNSRSTKIT